MSRSQKQKLCIYYQDCSSDNPKIVCSDKCPMRFDKRKIKTMKKVNK